MGFLLFALEVAALAALGVLLYRQGVLFVSRYRMHRILEREVPGWKASSQEDAAK